MIIKNIHKHIIILAIFCLMLGIFQGEFLEGKTANSNYRSFNNANELKGYMKWEPGKMPLISAHRGGPMDSYPENAVETFENALKYGPVLIECDVRLSRDKQLVMMHDDTLDRTSNGSGKVADHSLAQLKELFLRAPNGKMTAYRIPTFAEVLKWAKGRAVLTVDVKRGVPFQRIVDEIRKYKAEGHAIIITYNHNQLKLVHKLAPDLMVSSNAGGLEGAMRLLDTGVPADNLCAFVGTYEPAGVVYETLHKKGISTILGTMHNLDNKAAARGISVYRKLYENGADILSTDDVRLVSKAIEEMMKEKNVKTMKAGKK